MKEGGKDKTSKNNQYDSGYEVDQYQEQNENNKDN